MDVRQARRPGDAVVVGGDAGLGRVGRRRLRGEVADGEAGRRRLLVTERQRVVGLGGSGVPGSGGFGIGGVQVVPEKGGVCKERISGASKRDWSWSCSGRGRTGMTLSLNSARDPKRGRMRLEGMSTLLSATSVRKAWRKRCVLEGLPVRWGKMTFRMGREANVASSSGMT